MKLPLSIVITERLTNVLFSIAYFTMIWYSWRGPIVHWETQRYESLRIIHRRKVNFCNAMTEWFSDTSIAYKAPTKFEWPVLLHYNDVIMSAMASQITMLRLFTQAFIQAKIKENIKAPRHWPLWGEESVTGEFPAQRASNAENVSIWWRHHGSGHWNGECSNHMV